MPEFFLGFARGTMSPSSSFCAFE